MDTYIDSAIDPFNSKSVAIYKKKDKYSAWGKLHHAESYSACVGGIAIGLLLGVAIVTGFIDIENPAFPWLAVMGGTFGGLSAIWGTITYLEWSAHNYHALSARKLNKKGKTVGRTNAEKINELALRISRLSPETAREIKPLWSEMLNAAEFSFRESSTEVQKLFLERIAAITEFVNTVEGREAKFLSMERKAKEAIMVEQLNESSELQSLTSLKEIFVESVRELDG